MYRLSLSVAFLLASVSVSLACPGQTGKVIFSDDFSDDSGGWEVDANAYFGKGAFQVKAGGKVATDSTLNISFNATEGDYCLEAVFPSDPQKADNLDDVGMYFLTTNYQNKYAFSIATDGTAWIVRTTNGEAHYLLSATKVPAIKTEPGAVNTLRVVVKDQKLTFSVNGEQVKILRAPVTAAENRFGFWGGSNSKVPEQDRITQFKSFEVTEVP